MNNRVYLGEDGYVHWEFIGDQDYETVKQSELEISKLTKELHKAKNSLMFWVISQKLENRTLVPGEQVGNL